MKILIKLLRFKSDFFFVVVCDKRTKIEVKSFDDIAGMDVENRCYWEDKLCWVTLLY